MSVNTWSFIRLRKIFRILLCICFGGIHASTNPGLTNRNMDDKIGNKPGGPDGIQFDQFEPYPYIEKMGGIDLYLPVVPHAPDHRRLEAKIDDVVDEQFDKIAVIGFINTFSHIQNTVQRRCRVFSGAGF